MLESASKNLQTVFGYSAFRPLQAEIITSILDKRDTLVVMPTGGGKSLCYQLPALEFEGLTIVVSPLISLMKDQVEQLRAVGISAGFLNSSLEPSEFGELMNSLRSNRLKLLYIAPEALLRPGTLETLRSCRVDSITIDEAHCISEWGHDFRPEYRQLITLREQFSGAVFSAFTATATPRVRQDIQKNLGFSEPNAFVAGFDRENLFLEVADKVDPYRQVREFLADRKDEPGIIYCFSRNQVEDLAAALANDGFTVKPYHAGLPSEIRSANQDAFGRDDVQLIVATIAFGMGINKPNVRFVIHYDLPKNIESYYQQFGRAGRDGLPGHCLMLFGYGDIRKIRYLISEMSDDNERLIAEQHLNALVAYAQSIVCRRKPLLEHFGETWEKENCGECDNCRADPDRFVDVTVPAQKFLSCISRTGQTFGAMHIIDVLRGSKSKKVLQFGHTTVSTYGIGLELSKKQWLALSRQFLQHGLVQQGEYGSLKLTEDAFAVLRGEREVSGILVQDKPARERAPSAPVDVDQDLFQALRALRKRLADNNNVPPYVIFPDKTLFDMAAHFPRSRERMLEMHGVGVAKLRQYGHYFLEVITKFCHERGVGEASEAPADDGLPTGKRVSPRALAIGEAYMAGASFAELMQKFGIKKETLLQHLLTCVQQGRRIRTDELVALSGLPEATTDRVFYCFRRHGADFLRPTYDAMNREVGYPQLRVLQLYFLAKELEEKK